MDMPPIRPDSPIRMYCPRTDMNYQFSCLDEAIDFMLWSWEYWQHRPWNRHRRSSYEPATCPPPRVRASEIDKIWMDEARIMPPDEWFKVHIEGDFKDEVKAAPEPAGDDDTPF